MNETPKLAPIFNMKAAELYAYLISSAGNIIADFRSRQPYGKGVMGEFWNNRTSEAERLVFSRAFRDGEDMGVLLAHTVPYGVYLELKNDRQNEALRPVIEMHSEEIIAHAETIYAR